MGRFVTYIVGRIVCMTKVDKAAVKCHLKIFTHINTGEIKTLDETRYI